jgi:hypothetical protein
MTPQGNPGHSLPLRVNPQVVRLGVRALVAQGIEQRFPKPCVAGSIPAGGTQATVLIHNFDRLTWCDSWHEHASVVPCQ